MAVTSPARRPDTGRPFHARRAFGVGSAGERFSEVDMFVKARLQQLVGLGNATDGKTSAEKSSGTTIHKKNKNLDESRLGEAPDQLNASRQEAADALKSREKKPGMFAELLRNISAFFSKQSTKPTTAGKTGAAPGTSTSAATARPKAESRQLGGLPFTTAGLERTDEVTLTAAQKEVVDARMHLSRNTLNHLSPRSCLVGVLMASGMDKIPDGFHQEHFKAEQWTGPSPVRGPFAGLVVGGMRQAAALNSTTIDIRIALCRMAAEHGPPGFLEKFDQAAQITGGSPQGHGVTVENYWDVITRIQTLAWNELNASA